ncbi:MAG: flagellar motor switch protein FliN [bacterium]
MDLKKIQFPELAEVEHGSKIQDRTLGDIPVEVSVELGRTHMSLKELLDLKEGSIVELDRLAGEPLDLKVSGQLVAQGEVIAIDDYYGLKITNVLINK